MAAQGPARGPPPAGTRLCPGMWGEMNTMAQILLRPDAFDGFRFDISKGLGPGFMSTHNLMMGSSFVPGGRTYTFGAQFTPNKDVSLIVAGVLQRNRAGDREGEASERERERERETGRACFPQNRPHPLVHSLVPPFAAHPPPHPPLCRFSLMSLLPRHHHTPSLVKGNTTLTSCKNNFSPCHPF